MENPTTPQTEELFQNSLPDPLAHLEAERENGTRQVHRKDARNRSILFHEWHKSLSPSFACIDGDLIEFRKDHNGDFQPAALIELTVVDNYKIGSRVLELITERIFERTAHGRLLLSLADKLRVPGYIFAHREDLKEIQRLNIRHVDQGWREVTLNQIEGWLGTLKAPVN